MKHILVMSLASVLLYACATSSTHRVKNWSDVDVGPEPILSDVQPMIEERIRMGMTKPDAVTFSSWTKPYKDLKNWDKDAPIEGVWSLCVDVSSKDANGKVIGPKTYWAIVRDGAVLDTRDPGNFGSKEARERSAWRKKVCESGATLGNSPTLVK